MSICLQVHCTLYLVLTYWHIVCAETVLMWTIEAASTPLVLLISMVHVLTPCLIYDCRDIE